MCGIAGIFHADLSPIGSPELLERMTAVLVHRGPDGQGVDVDGPVGFGHRRLSIIDLVLGKQPMWNEDRTRAIVFNGEIYNFKSLRDELRQRGRRFLTRSDTEVILRAWEEYGEACLERLRGMFAFAIWDAPTKQLFVARDRIGIKPLYYYWDGRRFLFASELKALLEDPAVDRTLDLEALDDYLTYLYIPAPKTIFKRIRKLTAGHALTVSPRGLSEREYWDLRFREEAPVPEAVLAERLLAKLRESVDLHLESDVPLGAFLSGGLDSSVVVALMASLTGQPVRTASVGFRDEAFDERSYARLVARQFQTEAYEQVVDADGAKILDSLVWHFDEPFADSSMVPTYYVSQVARDRVTVSLSGDGGDENFAGYRRYRFDVLENRLRSAMPASIRRPVFGLLGRAYPKADWLPRPLRGKTLLTNLSVSLERGYFNTMSWFTPAMKGTLYRGGLRAALHDYDPFAVTQTYFDRTRGWDALSRVQYVDVKTYLADGILTKVDRASMAHSLEVRVPLLDHEVVEFAAGIPAASKLRGGTGKHILKQAVRGLLPREVIDRPKMGFSVPLARWFRGDLRPLFEEQVLARDSHVADLLRQDTIRRWWEQHQRGTRDYAPHLWALLMLDAWGRRFLRR